MNYRHAYHAGNFADVLKHATLALIIEHLKKKPAPFRVIDTHAGAGHYELGSTEAAKTGEWLDGIGRIAGPDAAPLSAPVADLLRPYLEAVALFNPPGNSRGALARYPGSPLIARALLRADDQLVANELHPEDSARLKALLGRDPRCRALSIDGWHAVKSLLPPKERRGVVLIDPPFEEPGETERLVAGLGDGVRRFATGIYLLWFPIKEPAATARLRAALAAAGHRQLLMCELHVRGFDSAAKLGGTGLAILNPPFGLEGQLATLLPFLVERLAQGPGAGWRLDQLGADAG